MCCLSIRDGSPETQQRLCLTKAVSLLYNKIICFHRDSTLCSDHTTEFQESFIHPSLRSLEMFKYVFLKHIRDQFCP